MGLTMFEAAELGCTVEKEEYKARVPALRAELLDAQQALRKDGRVAVIVLFAGVDTAGKGETVNTLSEWMDPRWLVARAYGPASDEERERPRFWRYWRDLPPKGRIGLFLSAWYSDPVLQRVRKETSVEEFDAQLDEIAAFERALTDDGTVIVKFWMHLDKKAQRKRLRTLEKDPLTHWRVTKEQWKNWQVYGRFIAAAERAIRRTSTPKAPWHIVEGLDERYRNLTAAVTLRDAIRDAVARSQRETSAADEPAPDAAREKRVPGRRKGARVAASDASPARASVEQVLDRVARERSVLDQVDLSLALDKKAFQSQLAKLQARLHLLERKALNRGISTIVVFEGWDAAGKGGAIRRITAALDARWYQVIPIAAPTDEERAQHYLWRFWRHLSRAGRLTIYDRSWYGRVLVERVEGFATRDEWMRAYSEINFFEELLVDRGFVVVKYWIHISQDEQLRRFKQREKEAHKRWKITEEDWRNREKWGDYELAVNDMVARTSTSHAPWTIVGGNDKYHARIQVLEVLCDRIEKRLKKKRD
jgi:polyphosphate kinase 2 (PPK2 family)